jgi:hypothetical protein
MAKSTSLFPDPPFVFTPAAERTEPRVWVRRLVLVEDRTPSANAIREVSLRRGLNVVRVAARPPDDSRIIAHSVGKTLLTRLIRYCLGEHHFATEERTAVIQDKFPTAYVLAEVRVNGSGWVVARPLRDGRANESFAVVADDWRSGLAPTTELQRFTEFTQTVEELVLSGLPKLNLPVAGHAPRWLDVLAWLARDAECKYQHPHEWHSPLARSGTARLDLNDASLITAWVMGVLDTEDISEQEKRQRWVEQRNAAKSAADRFRRRSDALEPILMERFRVTADELSGGLFGDKAGDFIATNRAELEKKRQDVLNGVRLGELQDEMIRTAAEMRVVECEIERVRGLQREAEVYLRQLRSGSQTPDEFYASFDRRVCPLKRTDCHYHPKNATTVPDDEREARIEQRQADYVRHAERLNELNGQLLGRQRAASDARQAYTVERNSRDLALRPIENEIGRWAELEVQLGQYVADRKTSDDEQAKVDRADKRIRDSQEQQRAVRAERERRVKRLSEIYDFTLKQLIGSGVGGSITRDARGLHPTPDDATTPGGATLGSLAHVIGLDLAYLSATAAGIGNLPGLLIHDSPESIVMESALYDRLLRFVLSLEAAFEVGAVGFQYIVTTTAPPPPEVARAPYEILTLDARSETTHLLRQVF